MLPWIEILPAFGHGGLVVTVLAAFAALLITRTDGYRGSKDGIYALAGVVAIPVLTELALTTWYLFSPTYLDHIEASAASVTQYFLQGTAVYPDLGSYTFHGLLYGPLLAEVSSLGYLFGSGVFASKLVGWVAAWTAIGLLLALPHPSGRRWHWAAAISSVLLVLTTFGSVLTADRADSLLLLCATAGFFCVLRYSGLPALAALALLAGAATDLKLHGPAYLLPALYWWVSEQRERRVGRWLQATGVVTVAGLIGVGLPFIPGNVDLDGYLGYIGLATKHGLAWGELISNCAFLLSLWAPPVLIFLATRVMPRPLRTFAALLFTVETVVAVIAGKPGAGNHHLLPFLCFHAVLLQRMLAAASEAPHDEERAARGAAVALAVVLVGTAWPAGAIFRYLFRFDLQLPRQEATRAELTRIAARYPLGMLGVSDLSSYPLTSFRPWLTLTGTRQTDYGAMMDLKLSGVSDAPLALALASCEIPYLFMPRPGVPFTLPNSYGGPLFSDAVRAEFLRRYSLLETGTDFDVYGCNRGSAH
ncbi:MAG TPA: hypothetical protein VNY82_05795 [Steroidobacteraceae bacterium]|nr:hypothetical protein [Steroidobacteraceae bacterium]